jgi:IclR family transcriptional regulator, KDG regulon repressor
MKTATTVSKVCSILNQFKDRQSFGLCDLARRTGLLPSDVHRVLAGLRVHGYIEQDSETKRYRLGFVLLRLGLLAAERNRLCVKAKPILARLSRDIEATTHLGILEGSEFEILWIDHIGGEAEQVFTAHWGGSDRLHCTAVGKAVLANVERRVMISVLERNRLVRLTPQTITDIATLECQFAQIRRQGYAVDVEEFSEGVCCIGCALLDCAGFVVGAISASMASSRFLACDESTLGRRIREAAVHISAFLSSSQESEETLGMLTPHP